MKKVGLCGGSGSGKGYVAAKFSDYGFFHVDTDTVYHNITSSRTPCTEKLSSEFGPEVLSADGGLNRRVLASIVFSDESKDKLKKLNEITHKFVLSEVRKIISECDKQSYKAVLVDAPLLFESGFDKECDFVIAVVADRDIRISRITERDKITREEAETRINAQLDDSFLYVHSDFVIVNNGDAEALRKDVLAIADKILN